MDTMIVRTGYKDGFVSVSGRLNHDKPFLQLRQLSTAEFIKLCCDRVKFNNGSKTQ